MPKLSICTIEFDNDKNTWMRFKELLIQYMVRWAGKIKHTFVPVSVSYVQGGTHIIEIVDIDVYNNVVNDLGELLARDWPEYKINTR